MKNFTIILLVFLMASCASGPKFAEVSSDIPNVVDGYGRIYLYRKTAVGAAVQPKIYMNGDIIGKAKPKGFFYIDVKPGDYKISASTEAKRVLSLSMDSGDVKYVRLEMKMGFFVGHVKPVLVDASIGKSELKKMSYTGE